MARRKTLFPRRPGAKGDGATGYGHPPKASRFKPGRSGNPNGRPKGSRNRTQALPGDMLRSIVLAEAVREIKVRDGRRTTKISASQAIVRTIVNGALQGRARSQRLAVELLTAAEASKNEEYTLLMEAAIDYKIEAQAEKQRRLKAGDMTELVPDPDHIHIDLKNGTIAVEGPMTSEEKKHFDVVRDMIKEFEVEIERLTSQLLEASDQKQRRKIQRDLNSLEERRSLGLGVIARISWYFRP